MKLFLKYLYGKRKTVILFFAFSILFLISISLFRLPIPSVLYPTAICILIGSVYLIVDFLHVKRRHDAMERLSRLSADMLNMTDLAATVTEEDLVNIIEALKREVSAIRTEDTKKYNDMLDYYTVWAHQIKTPIASMKLLLEQDDTDTARRLSADLFRIQNYVDMVLAFLRLGAETGDYVLREQPLDPILRGSARKFAADFIARKLTLTFEPTGLTAVTDEKWFAFLFEQLLSNALKYTRTGGITITAEENTLVLSDTGIGIAPEDLPRLGQKGFTGNNGRTDHSASGLGLYLCRRVADNLGIEFRIESVVGQGTKVFLRLPQSPSLLE